MTQPLSFTRAAAVGLLVAGAIAAPALAVDAAQRGFEIAQKSDRSDNGFGDSAVSAKMILRNAAGKSTEREMTFRTLERENEEVGDKSLVVFQSPRDVRSTALLNHAQILTSDDQWLYLPALKRVKRISSSSKSGPFVGSEFAFEDFTAGELKKFNYEFIGEDTVRDKAVYVVDRFPLYENSGYTRQRSYIDQETYQLRRLEFFDRKSSKLKTLDFLNYKRYAQKFWRAHLFRMVNHQTGKSTDIVYDEYTFGQGLSASDFDQSKLKLIR
ncbi:MAG: outer membrane lipoprotein-sorting protein [Pseudomonadota bacterium]